MAEKGKIMVKEIHHRGSDHYGLFFDYDLDLINMVKKVPNRRYSKTLQCWYMPMTEESIMNLKKLPIVIERLDQHPEAPDAREQNLLDSKDWSIKKQKVLDQMPRKIQPKISNMMDHMLLQWYPWRMIKNYTQLILLESTELTSAQLDDQKRAQKLFNIANDNLIHDY